MEKSLGNLSFNEMKDLLRPIPPKAPPEDSEVKIKTRHGSLLYTYSAAALSYEAARQYQARITLTEKLIEKRRQKTGKSTKRAKAVVCVQYAVGMNEFVNYALKKHDEFSESAFELIAGKLIGDGFLAYALYNFQSVIINLKEKKADLRAEYLNKFFEAVRKVFFAPPGRPAGSKTETIKNKEKIEEVMIAIEKICRARMANHDPKADLVSQKDVAKEMNTTDKSVRNWINKTDKQSYRELRDKVVRKTMNS